MYELGKTRGQIIIALRLLVEAGHMMWMPNDTTRMTERGMSRAERLGQVEDDLMAWRQRALQAWNVEQAWNAQRQADGVVSRESLKLWSEEMRSDEKLRRMFSALKTALMASRIMAT